MSLTEMPCAEIAEVGAAEGPPGASTGSAVSAVRMGLYCLLLALATLAIFGRTLGNEFIELDDNVYVTDNPMVRQGFTAESLRWVCRAEVGGNWHPLTMLSHMLDCQIFGMQAWGHHLTAILWHSANVALCGWMWWRMTGQAGASLAAAALFGWHPLRVESVAWVAERKDVLSTFFGLLAIMMYANWTRKGGLLRYGLTLFWMGCSLLSKPMLVTLPCVLLLLDYWPLGRMADAGQTETSSGRRLVPLIVEKLPLFGLSAAFCITTLNTQNEMGVRSFDDLPVFWRLANAVSAYAEYLGQTVWPAKLAVFYRHPTNTLPLAYAALAVLVMTVLTWQAVLNRRKYPSLIVGWLWYLGTLVPVIGLIQVGGAGHADRYTYVPMIGLMGGISLAAAKGLASQPGWRKLAVAGLAAWLGVQSALTWRQIGLWHDPARLFEHTVAVTERNFFAHFVLGSLRMDEKDYEGAIERFSLSLAAKPEYGEAAMAKGYCERKAGKLEDARQTYLNVVRTGKASLPLQADYALLLLQMNRLSEAERQFVELLQKQPTLDDAMVGMGLIAGRRGRLADAEQWYAQALAAAPVNLTAADRWARLLALHPDAKVRRPQEALVVLERLCAGAGARDARLWDTWALALGAAGQYSRGVETAEAALAHAKEIADEDQRRLLEAAIDRHLSQLRQRRAVFEDPADAEAPADF